MRQAVHIGVGTRTRGLVHKPARINIHLTDRINSPERRAVSSANRKGRNRRTTKNRDPQISNRNPVKRHITRIVYLEPVRDPVTRINPRRCVIHKQANLHKPDPRTLRCINCNLITRSLYRTVLRILARGSGDVLNLAVVKI